MSVHRHWYAVKCAVASLAQGLFPPSAAFPDVGYQTGGVVATVMRRSARGEKVCYTLVAIFPYLLLI